VAHTSKTYEDLLLAIKGKGLKVTQAKAGVKLDVGSGIEAVKRAPNSSSYEWRKEIFLLQSLIITAA